MITPGDQHRISYFKRYRMEIVLGASPFAPACSRLGWSDSLTGAHAERVGGLHLHVLLAGPHRPETARRAEGSRDA